MTVHTSNYPINALVLSHSSRSTWKKCERKFEFNKLYGDAEDKEEIFAGGVGNALHDGFQEYLISKDINKAIFAFMLSYPYALEFLKPENHHRSLEASYATLQELIQSTVVDEYELVRIKTPNGDIQPAIEVPFAIEIVGSPFTIPVYFVGFIDAILFSKVKQQYMVVDIKTHRINLLDMSAKYEFDEQTVPYGIILEQILGRTVTEFEVGYLSAYIDLMEPKVKFYPFTKRQSHIQDWYRGICIDIGRMWKNYKNEFWPRATDGNVCLAFNRPCWFLEYCAFREPAVVHRMLGTKVREGLFHDGKEPWFTAQLDYKEFA